MFFVLKKNPQMEPYYIIEPKVKKVPFILSVPHCGVEFPTELKEHYNQTLIQQPDDTDWFVQELYNFASELGITIIYAKYSRWVIDLNRDPESKPLYNDGRIITALTPVTDFFGNNIYQNEGLIPSEQETERRLKKYYWPYYKKIEELIAELKIEFKEVLFWDAHSIRSFVPTIRKEKFPDMILGDNDEKTAHKKLIQTALEGLSTSTYQVNHNTPFKGGHLTRYFGNPQNGVNALQLEMTKLLYMEDNELDFSTQRANKVREVLKNTFNELIKKI